MPLLIPRVIPHGLTRFGSVDLTIPGISERRFVWVKVGALVAAADRRCGATATTAEAAEASRSIRVARYHMPAVTETLREVSCNDITDLLSSTHECF